MRELKNCENRKKRNARERGKKLADVSPTFKNCNTITYLFALLATKHGTQYADCQTTSNKAVQVDAKKPPTRISTSENRIKRK